MEEYKEYDEQGKIICQVCGKSFSIISPSHLQRKHNITLKEYKNKYPGIAITSKQFNTSRKYETTDMFNEKKPVIEEKIVGKPVVEKPIDIKDPGNDPIFEELQNQKSTIPKKSKKPTDKIAISRFKILVQLQKYYKHMKQNYMIQKFSRTGHLEYEFITDYADPVLKIIVNFTKTFWHNSDMNEHPSKNRKLKEDGWKIIEIRSNHASTAIIDETMKK